MAAGITKLSSLSSLNISGNQLEDAGAAKIAKMTSLRLLNISDNRISDEGTRHIAENLKSLTFLRIFRNQIAEAVIQELREQLPGCRIVFLGIS